MSKNLLLFINLPLLMIFQMSATCFMKWGSTASNRYWWGVILANLATFISVIILVNVYKLLSPAMACGICTGATFVCCQLALLAVFKESIPPMGWAGLITITAGIIMFAMSR